MFSVIHKKITPLSGRVLKTTLKLPIIEKIFVSNNFKIIFEKIDYHF